MEDRKTPALPSLASILHPPSSILHPPSLFRVDWHLSERDFLPEAGQRLARLARLVSDGAPWHLSSSGRARPVPLAEGIDRRCPAVLLTVGLHLPRLAAQVLSTPQAHGPEVPPAGEATARRSSCTSSAVLPGWL